MSALFSGQIVLENARQVGDSPVVAFDGQMWHGTGRVMTGLFRYYNHANLSFDDVGQYFAWIHVAKYVGPTHSFPTGDVGDSTGDTEKTTATNSQEDDRVVKSENSSQTLGDPDVVHVVGDITELIPTSLNNVSVRPYVILSGTSSQSNKLAGFFHLNPSQYTTFYKTERSSSALPVRGHFNSSKYQKKKPVPLDNYFVCVEGFLDKIDIDSNGYATLFHVAVENISFGSRMSVPQTNQAASSSSTSRSSKFKFAFPDQGTAPADNIPVSASEHAPITPQNDVGVSTRTGKRKK